MDPFIKIIKLSHVKNFKIWFGLVIMRILEVLYIFCKEVVTSLLKILFLL